MQGYACWSACLDAPAPAPSNSFPSLAPPALRPPSIVLDSKTSTPDWPCWSAWRDAPAPSPSNSSPSLSPPALRPPSIVLDSCTIGLLPSSLIPVRRRQIGHAGQRGGMLLPQHPQTRLHHFHLQLFGLLPSSLIPVRSASFHRP